MAIDVTELDWPAILAEVRARVVPCLGQGRVADYIPALASADPNAFAVSVALSDGRLFTVGDSDTRFSIQSVSKVFALTMALEFAGDDLWDRVGREPSGNQFNSIVQLEREGGIPRNPFINAGAMVVTDIILSQWPGPTGIEALLAFIRELAASQQPTIDLEVAASEEDWGDRNRSLAYFMKSFGALKNPAQEVLATYFSQCAIAMTTTELARAGLFLANEGIDPISARRVIAHEHANRINALMLTCGHYDMSGDFAFRVGLPGKSGVGGGILAVVPARGCIAVWSPGLNAAGNSLAGTRALELISEAGELNLF